MPFWVPGKDAVIGVTKDDIEKYASEYSAGKLKMPGKSGYQQSFAYFIRNKLGVPEYQKVSVEVSYVSKEVANTQGSLGHPHRGDTQTNYIDLSDLDLKGLNFSNVSFYYTKFPADLTDTILLGAKFDSVDFKGKNIKDALVDRNIFQGTTLDDGADKVIRENIEALEAFSTENLRSADGLLIGKNADFRLVLGLIITGDADLERSTIIDPAFHFFRLSYAMGNKDSKEDIDQIERASKRVIYDITQVVVGEALGAQSVGRKVGEAIGRLLPEWLKKRGPGFIQEDEKESERNKVLEDINHVFAECKDYLRYEFFPQEDKDKVKTFLEDNVERFASCTDDQRLEMIRQATQPWIDSQTAANQRWKTIQERASKGKIKENARVFERHAKKTGQLREGEFWDCLKRDDVPDALSLSKPSKYPAIDPTDTESISRDIYLKQRGAKFLATIAGVGTGAIVAPAATKLVSSIATSYGVPLPTVGTGAAVVGGAVIGGLLYNNFAAGIINDKNHHKLNNRLGDSLLELGVLAEVLEPHLKALGLILVGAAAADHIVPNGGLLKFIKDSYSGVVAAAAAYTGYKNYKAIKGEIDKQSKGVFESRLRPGSEPFDNKIKKKLFDLPKVIVIVTLATVGCVIAGPVLFHGLLIAKLLPDLALMGLLIAGAVTGAVTGAGTAYFGYGAVKSFYGFVSSHVGRTERGNEDERAIAIEHDERRVNAGKVILKNFKKYKAHQNMKSIIKNKQQKAFLALDLEHRKQVLALKTEDRSKILQLDDKNKIKAFFSLDKSLQSKILQLDDEDKIEAFFSLNESTQTQMLHDPEFEEKISKMADAKYKDPEQDEFFDAFDSLPGDDKKDRKAVEDAHKGHKGIQDKDLKQNGRYINSNKKGGRGAAEIHSNGKASTWEGSVDNASKKGPKDNVRGS